MSRAVSAGVCAHVALLSAIVLAWSSGDAAAIVPSHSFYQDIRLLQIGMLVVLLPWVASRCMPSGLPVEGFAARALAPWGATALVAIAGLPIAILAQRMAGAGGSLLTDQLAVQVIAIAATAAVLLSQSLSSNRVARWVWATATLAAAVVLAFRVLPS